MQRCTQYPRHINDIRAEQVFEKKNKWPELYSPGGICYLYRDKPEELQRCSCNSALKCGAYCEECQVDIQGLERCGCKKIAVYDLLRTGIAGGQCKFLQGIMKKTSHEDLMCMEKRAN